MKKESIRWKDIARKPTVGGIKKRAASECDICDVSARATAISWSPKARIYGPIDVLGTTRADLFSRSGFPPKRWLRSFSSTAARYPESLGVAGILFRASRDRCNISSGSAMDRAAAPTADTLFAAESATARRSSARTLQQLRPESVEKIISVTCVSRRK